MNKRPSIVLIHGMWSTPAVWRLFQDYYLEQGYKVYTPALRHHDGSHQDKAQLGRTSIRDYVDDLARFITSLDQPPVLIGHSMGGLLALLLAGKGLARQAVLLAPAAPAGILPIKPSVIRVFAGVLGRWGFWRKPMKLSPRAADYGLFNRLPDEARVGHYQDMVFESGRAAAEIAFWPLDRHRSTRLEQNPSCKILVMAGQNDRITPASICHQIACRFDADFHLLEQHAHWLLSEPGWERVAEQSEIWLSMQSSPESL